MIFSFKQCHKKTFLLGFRPAGSNFSSKTRVIGVINEFSFRRFTSFQIHLQQNNIRGVGLGVRVDVNEELKFL